MQEVGYLFLVTKKLLILIFSCFAKTTELTHPRAPGVSVTVPFLGDNLFYWFCFIGYSKTFLKFGQRQLVLKDLQGAGFELIRKGKKSNE